MQNYAYLSELTGQFSQTHQLPKGLVKIRRTLALVALTGTFWASSANAQTSTRSDSLRQVDLPGVVVTATRSARALERAPTPTQVVEGRDAVRVGALRISDVLGELASLQLTHGPFGTGLQLRGLDPAYTLILIDGHPVTARTGGTVDLERLPTDAIERIEIVKGPSSSLYGSEALAGVVNIITSAPPEGLSAAASFRGETHGTRQAGGRLGFGGEQVSGHVGLGRYTSDGYDLSAAPGATAPGFRDLSADARVEFEALHRWRLGVRGRVSDLEQRRGTAEGVEATDRLALELGVEASTRVGGVGIRANVLANRSGNDTALPTEDGPVLSDFALGYYRGETQANWTYGRSHLVMAGAGVVNESVSGSRISGDARQALLGYGFVQHEYAPAGALQTSLSLRLDAHDVYGSHISPKAAALYTVGSATRVRVSVGSGFKAPTFQQLFLDFSNPGPGYSVVGAADAADALARFQSAGEIAYLMDAASVTGALRPEKAWTFEVGFDRDVGLEWRFQARLFHTRLRDMIETQPVAAKTNGQFVFSYANLSRVSVPGIEAEVSGPLRGGVHLSAGYQFLRARDLDVLDDIDEGLYFRRENGRDARLERSDYGGLFNRSAHSANLALHGERGDVSASVRAVYRSRFGYGDRNGNLILDAEEEYAPGHTLVNATVNWAASPRLLLTATVLNATDRVYPTLIPSLSGRLFQAGLTLKSKP